MRDRFLFVPLAAALLGLSFSAAAVHAADDDRQIELGKLVLEAPKAWEKKKPQSRIVAYEFSASSKDEKDDARFTVMKAGGTIEANLQRWYAQFKQPDGGSTKERAKVEKKQIAGRDVHLVDIAGTYIAPPFAGGGVFPNYRMLGGIVVADDGLYFLKFLGPRETIAEHEKAFARMVENLRAR